MDSEGNHNSSSSSSYSPWKYDVFLSFFGEDTRKTFTDFLYRALVDAKVDTFRDNEELPRGSEITLELLKAIEGSMISIVVLSKNYASSRWCLDELVKIMECKTIKQQVVVPVFYDVEPTDVRHQTGCFADAFTRHEQNGSKVEVWRHALANIANIAGWNVQEVANGYESKSIIEIVGMVLKYINRTYLPMPKYPVGLDSKVEELKKLLHFGSVDVRSIGIWGVGGGGKTTLAKALYNSVCHQFEGCCFLANVSKVSQQNGLVYLQKKLLSELLKTEIVGKLRIENVDEGITLLRRRLYSKRVLIILDDLVHLHDFERLFGGYNWLGLGSKLVITTRDQHLLLGARVDAVYDAPLLQDRESLELLCWHAFHQPIPLREYWERSITIVKDLHGLPLFLELVGSSFFEDVKIEWESEDYATIILQCLDALPDENADIFVNIACFLLGTDYISAVDILSGCGFLVETGIRVLIDRYFLKINGDNTLEMHEMIAEMGRYILRQKSRTGKFKRFWFHGDACNNYNITINHKGPENIEGVFVAQQQISHKAYAKTSNSRVLPVNTHPSRCFDGMRRVSWYEYPLDSLPAEANLEKLVALELHHSSISTLWEGIKVLPNLSHLDLSNSKLLVMTPDFSEVPRLQKLYLRSCEGLLKVHPSIGLLGKLTDLDLECCNNLKSLPNNICRVRSLVHLNLNGCSKLEQLPEQLGQMESLWVLDASGTAIEQLPDSIGYLPQLLELKLNTCENLQSLPNSICNIRSLKYLSLSYCSNLHLLPKQLGNIDSIGLLKNLTLLSSNLCNSNFEAKHKPLFSFFPIWIPFICPSPNRFLPSSLSTLCSLTHLNLRNCELSETDFPRKLEEMCSVQHLDLRGNLFTSLPLCVTKLTNLKVLLLDGCKNLQLIPDFPPKLQHLNASGCTSLETLPDLSNMMYLEYLNFENCHRLLEIRGLENLCLLPEICLAGCSNLASIQFGLRQGYIQESEALPELLNTIMEAGSNHVFRKIQRKRRLDGICHSPGTKRVKKLQLELLQSSSSETTEM